MQHFYDAQIRKYLVQVIRLLSNFVVKYGDGTLVRVPVMYGDQDRQVAYLVSNNSENMIQSAPRISVYIQEVDLDTSRLADASYTGKLHFRERKFNEATGTYSSEQGNTYTVERLMPTPFKLTLKVDIWSTSIDQKLQILEQILMLFNPSLELQTTDNYVDWASLTVLDLTDVNFNSRTIPAGTNVDIDVATLTLVTPIYISPPAKVKRLGVVTNIVTNLLGSINTDSSYIEGLGTDNSASSLSTPPESPIGSIYTTIGDCKLVVSEGTLRITNNLNYGEFLSWSTIISQNPEVYQAGLSRIFLRQPNGSYVVGFVSLSSLDESIMVVNWDTDTYPSNTDIVTSSRASSGTFDAIINPYTFNPKRPNKETSDQPIVAGTRYLTLENIGGGVRDTFIAESSIQRINTSEPSTKVKDHKVFVNGIEVGSGSEIINGDYYIILDNIASYNSEISYELILNTDGPNSWKNLDSTDFIASENDVIEWDGTKWNVILSAKETENTMVYLTNIYTGTQYKWNGVNWSKSFEGEYEKGYWRIEK